MIAAPNKNGSDKQFDQLREILLGDVKRELERIRTTVEEKDKLSYHVAPIIQEHIEYLKNNYPDEFREVVDKQIDYRLKESQDELIAVIYPAVGQMIKKYVAHQILLLRESIEDRIEETKKSGIIGWIRRTIFRIDDSEWILAKAGGPVVEGIYVIEKESGILLGSASAVNTADEDLLACMLTAIRGFMEDAFLREAQSVDMIEYDSLTIFIQSYPKYYIAVSLNGKMTNTDKDRLAEELLKFTRKKLNKIIISDIEGKEETIRQRLNERFLTPQKLLDQSANS